MFKYKNKTFLTPSDRILYIQVISRDDILMTQDSNIQHHTDYSRHVKGPHNILIVVENGSEIILRSIASHEMEQSLCQTG